LLLFASRQKVSKEKKKQKKKRKPLPLFNHTLQNKNPRQMAGIP